jgi:hypothetical protein
MGSGRQAVTTRLNSNDDDFDCEHHDGDACANLAPPAFAEAMHARLKRCAGLQRPLF